MLGATLTFIALVLLWEMLVRELKIPGWLLPAPSAIAVALGDWRGELVRHSLVTLYETLVGFALAIAISIPLAVAIVYSPILRNTIYPICSRSNPFQRSRLRHCWPCGLDSARCQRSW